ncbi:hypothetical protein VNO77_27687 [Canavalia gladiata]|uniref:Uncharacterized protein n=1 Tax=Canavalia gladiata TaxID=3824 RepID=A0AAN9KV62_CANGL
MANLCKLSGAFVSRSYAWIVAVWGCVTCMHATWGLLFPTFDLEATEANDPLDDCLVLCIPNVLLFFTIIAINQI